MAPTFSVAVLLYPGADILDFSGPVEIYSTQPRPPSASSFHITTFSQHNPVESETRALVYTPNTTLSAIDQKLEDYDILVVPGAMPDLLHKMIANDEGKAIAALISKFAALPPRKETGARIIQSVCTGALLLAASGVLAGRTVTTHHIAYEDLKRIADRVAGGDSRVNVVPKRWVDAGKTEAGVRIVNAGGVTSGIDTSLWIVEELVGKEVADWVAEVVEFERRAEGDAWGVKKE